MLITCGFRTHREQHRGVPMNTENRTALHSPHTSPTDSLGLRPRSSLALARGMKSLAIRATAALRWWWTRGLAPVARPSPERGAFWLANESEALVNVGRIPWPTKGRPRQTERGARLDRRSHEQPPKPATKRPARSGEDHRGAVRVLQGQGNSAVLLPLSTMNLLSLEQTQKNPPYASNSTPSVLPRGNSSSTKQPPKSLSPSLSSPP